MLTLPIQAKACASVLSQVKKYSAEVDAFEIWIDQLSENERTPQKVSALITMAAKIKPIVAVCKNRIEHGKFEDSVESKVDLLIRALASGAAYVDAGIHTKKLQLNRLSGEVRKQRRKPSSKYPALIISHHDFAKTPSANQLQSLVKKMRSFKPDVLKIACRVKKLADNNTLINLADELSSQHQRHIIIGMGELGKVTRIMSRQMGNELCFVSAEKSTAPGQLTVREQKRFLEIH